MRWDSSRCQKCGEQIGWLGRAMEWARLSSHDCRPAAPQAESPITGGGPCPPWESLAQVSPEQLERALEGRVFERPWRSFSRGNGHLDLVDADGHRIAHVYCWDEDDWARLKRIIKTKGS